MYKIRCRFFFPGPLGKIIVRPPRRDRCAIPYSRAYQGLTRSGSTTRVAAVLHPYHYSMEQEWSLEAARATSTILLVPMSRIVQQRWGIVTPMGVRQSGISESRVSTTITQPNQNLKKRVCFTVPLLVVMSAPGSGSWAWAALSAPISCFILASQV
ncbi:hypothetical protein DFH94DRAFT_12464 [Russula ochroleuca]|uniref:Uncharacterized protein n=1 Tax=Russula ochroleuca TaxID=152965 RepID=A0A9P5N5F7_9AGAM|nr:hypothetical protein DFH94DRAFT_12464 [Russula ochroleuca]